MKKNILVLMMMILTLPMVAQTWGTKTIQGDELKGTQNQIVTAYIDEYKTLYFSTVRDNYFKILTSKSLFDYSPTWIGASGKNLVMGIVGIYDIEEKLIEKIEILFEVEDNRGTVLHPNKYTKMGGNNFKRCKKILDYIKNEQGYIRIILPLYDSVFDFKVPTLKSYDDEIINLDSI